jgi:hypothetical protein
MLVLNICEHKYDISTNAIYNKAKIEENVFKFTRERQAVRERAFCTY